MAKETIVVGHIVEILADSIGHQGLVVLDVCTMASAQHTIFDMPMLVHMPLNIQLAIVPATVSLLIADLVKTGTPMFF